MNLQIPSKIKIPEDVIPKKEFLSMNRKNRRFYLNSMIITILKLNSKNERGITILDLHAVMNFVSIKTLRLYLENLIASGEVYCLKGKPIRYFINGRVSHSIPGGSFNLSDRVYDLYLIANNLSEILSPIIFIQESKIDEYDELEKKGGIMIKGEDFDDFLISLQAYLPKIKSYAENFNKQINEVID